MYNGQGDIVGLVDYQGNQVVSYTYDAWGKPLTITGLQAAGIGELNPFRYRGYYNRKPGRTPLSSWPPLPENIGGKKPKWNPNGYLEGKEGNLTWDNRSHGAEVDRGDGAQDGHWDDENSNRRWDRNGSKLGGSSDNYTNTAAQAAVGTVSVSAAS